MHEDNVNNKFGDILTGSEGTAKPFYNPDKYLPVSFCKHIQSWTCLNSYLEVNPQEPGTVVNNKNETIRDRFQNNIKSDVNSKNLSLSAHKKRRREYKTLHNSGVLSHKGVV